MSRKTYNRSAAASYALKHVYLYNDDWPTYKGRGGDCANFVSQALHAGGWTMMRRTYINGPILMDHAMKTVMEQDRGSWFCTKMGSLLFRSNTWGAAANLGYFLDSSGRARRCQVSDLEIGDVVLLEQYTITYHAMIVTGVFTELANPSRKKIPYLSYHTNDTLNKPITYFSESILRCWKIRDEYEDSTGHLLLKNAIR